MNEYAPTSPAEQAYDHLDDLGIFDAATIRQMTDYDQSNTPQAEQVPPATAEDMAHYGANRAEWSKAFATPEGRRRNENGLKAARLAIREGRE